MGKGQIVIGPETFKNILVAGVMRATSTGL